LANYALTLSTTITTYKLSVPEKLASTRLLEDAEQQGILTVQWQPSQGASLLAAVSVVPSTTLNIVKANYGARSSYRYGQIRSALPRVDILTTATPDTDEEVLEQSRMFQCMLQYLDLPANELGADQASSIGLSIRRLHSFNCACTAKAAWVQMSSGNVRSDVAADIFTSFTNGNDAAIVGGTTHTTDGATVSIPVPMALWPCALNTDGVLVWTIPWKTHLDDMIAAGLKAAVRAEVMQMRILVRVSMIHAPSRNRTWACDAPRLWPRYRIPDATVVSISLCIDCQRQYQVAAIGSCLPATVGLYSVTDTPVVTA
jgi:hypothetical protein